mgnify:CR=1 FL=1
MSREIKFRAWNTKFNVMYVWQTILDSLKLERLLEGHPEVNLMQYTGLKDKNGVEIYEDDLWFYDGCHYLVQWTNAYAGFSLVATELDNKHTGEILQMFHAAKGVVIGNIYENPELLESAS